MTSRNALLFIFLTMLIDTIGLGLIIPVAPGLIAELTHTGLSGAASWGGWLFFAYGAMQFLFGPTIGNLSEDHRAQRSDDKAEREEYCRVQLLNDWIVTRKKEMREIKRKSGVRVEVVPLDEIADRTNENSLAAPTHIERCARCAGRQFRQGLRLQKLLESVAYTYLPVAFARLPK